MEEEIIYIYMQDAVFLETRVSHSSSDSHQRKIQVPEVSITTTPRFTQHKEGGGYILIEVAALLATPLGRSAAFLLLRLLDRSKRKGQLSVLLDPQGLIRNINIYINLHTHTHMYMYTHT